MLKNLPLKRWLRPVLLWSICALALWGITQLWHDYNAKPSTRDGRLRGDIIQVSSDVSGVVTDVLVQDNQQIKKGQVLFKIDVERQALDMEQAQADLIKAQASLLQAQAGLAEAKANQVRSAANLNLAQRNAERYGSLMDGAISKQEQDQMFAARDQAAAEHEQMQAAIGQAQANIEQQKALIEVAKSQLNLAKLNLNRAEVRAPADGVLSNFELKAGNYVKVGQAVGGLLDRQQLYVVGYFEETKLQNIQVGAKATVQFMGDQQRLKGHVQGIALGIDDRERSASQGILPNVNPTFTWVRLAQRIPVKIILDELPENPMALVAGRTVSIAIEAPPK